MRDIAITVDLHAWYCAFSDEPFGVVPFDEQRVFEIDASVKPR